MGCQQSKARARTLRCQLEATSHDNTAFTTLTYDDDNRPEHLDYTHLSGFLKRLRRRLQRPATNRTIRFLASGEYGETTRRPHYHLLIFGLGAQHADLIEDTWPHGFTRTHEAQYPAIAYTAGYTQKKLGAPRHRNMHHVDPSTGEYKGGTRRNCKWPCCQGYQQAFIETSRRPGLAAYAAHKYKLSWRKFAILNDNQIPVPRYLNEVWKTSATLEQIEVLNFEREQEQILRGTLTKTQLEASYQIALARHANAQRNRKY